MSKRKISREIRKNATAFLIWRAATSVKWDCTYTELAHELKMSPSNVGLIARQRGWKFVGDHKYSPGSLNNRRPVTFLMSDQGKLKGNM